MALPAAIQAIVTRFRGTNNNAYSAANNPLGLGQGGQRQNFPPRLKDMADALDFVADRADSADANVALTAEDASNTKADRIATGQDVLASAGNVTASRNQADRARDEADRSATYGNPNALTTERLFQLYW